MKILKKKLQEEITEYITSEEADHQIEELADIPDPRGGVRGVIPSKQKYPNQ